MASLQIQKLHENQGFTMVELIMVMVIIGVVAVAALPRFANQNAFDSRGFSDQTFSILRFAQKTAVAQRRNVCVAFTANSVTLTIDTLDPSLGPSVCSGASVMPMTDPNGVAPYNVIAKSGTGFTAVPVNFQFYALGSASVTQTMQVQGVAGGITVEGTGYVHP